VIVIPRRAKSPSLESIDSILSEQNARDHTAGFVNMDSGLGPEPVIGPATSGRTRWERPGMTIRRAIGRQ
jgi:hypothetical protein